MRDVLVCITRARSGGRTGLWAKLTPLRFEGGSRLGMRRGQRYVIEPLVVDGREQLYILTFCLPRFLNLTYREKLVTVFHELFHIGPQFDGDHRRFAGRYHMHSPRSELFDSEAERLCDLYLATSPAPLSSASTTCGTSAAVTPRYPSRSSACATPSSTRRRKQPTTTT